MSGRDQGKHIPYGPNMLEPLSALLPASTLQSVHSTQKTRSSSHTPEHPFYTEDVVQHPHSRASTLHRRRGPAPSLQSVHSTQKTWSRAHTPEHPFYTEDMVQPRSLLGLLLPVLHRGSTHLLPTASPCAPPSSSLKSHNASCSEASPAEILEGLLCPSGTDAYLAWGL